MHPMINIALRAARDAGDALALSFERRDAIAAETDSQGRLVTKQDGDALKTLAFHLEKSFPNHGIQSRLHDKPADQQVATVWHLDCLLGPDNFLAGHPACGLSLAAEVKGRIEHAVLLFPLLHEEFTASRGAGAQLNARRIRVQQEPFSKRMLIGSNSDSGSPPPGFAKFIVENSLLLRDSGCAELDLCMASCGRLAAGWHGLGRSPGLRAAELIFSEAGGLIGDAKGGPRSESSVGCLYGGPKTFKSLVKGCA